MSSYNIGTKNAFHLLCEDEDQPLNTSDDNVSSRTKDDVSKSKSKATTAHSNSTAKFKKNPNKHRAPKHEYDRHSGSGRQHENKREGSGRFNWGADNDQGEDVRSGRNPRRGRSKNFRDNAHYDAPADNADDASASDAKAEGVENSSGYQKQRQQAPVVVDSDDDKLELSEYLEQLKELNCGVDTQLNIRRAVDDDDGTEAFIRDTDDMEENELLTSGESKVRKEKRKAKKKGTISLDEFTAKTASAPMRNYRSRGGGYRGDRGSSRDDYRGDRNSSRGGYQNDRSSFRSGYQGERNSSRNNFSKDRSFSNRGPQGSSRGNYQSNRNPRSGVQKDRGERQQNSHSKPRSNTFPNKSGPVVNIEDKTAFPSLVC